MPTITATTHDATFGVVSVIKRTSRPYSHAVIRVSDAGDVSASFHMTREAADKAGGRPAPGVTRHVVPVEKPIHVANRNTQKRERNQVKNVPASTKYPARFDPRVGEYGRHVWTDGDPVFTTDGIPIVQGLRVFTNNLDRGTIDLTRASYDWHEPEQRWQLWFDVVIDHDYKGNATTGRELQSDCRVTTRFDGRNA